MPANIHIMDANYFNERYGVMLTESEREGVYVKCDGSSAWIGYQTTPQKLRAYYLLDRELKNKNTSFEIYQKPHFDTCGPMIDVSRGGAMKVSAIKQYIEKTAMLGLNMFMLYTEDMFELKDYPKFGYMRGRYSATELKEIDDFAFSLGIEVIPCIQTLGHLENYLHYGEVPSDNNSVLLVGEEETYQFIEAEIKMMRACFRSNRIHLGMDEAFGLGLGKYLKKNGYEKVFNIFNKHLDRVIAIAEKYKYHAMIWSDMYFSTEDIQDYYKKDYVIPQDAIDAAPQDVELVFWDYYHKEYDYYNKKMEQHERFPNKLVFAGGIWTWDGFLPNFRYTLETMKPALSCAIDHGVKTVIATLWGNDGNETDHLLALSSLAVFSEMCYCGTDCTDENIYSAAEYISGERRELTEAVASFFCGYDGAVRIGKAILYGDPLIDLIQYDIDYATVIETYQNALHVIEANSDCANYSYYKAVFDAALLKAELLKDLRSEYKIGNIAYLKECAVVKIPMLRKYYRTLYRELSKRWSRYYKQFAYEKYPYRFGGIDLRLEQVAERLSNYAEGKISCIEELDEERIGGINKTWRQFSSYTRV